ncbi:phasin [Siculibacillus lacustris]|uniref:Phasin n=1 Tax=Siculibacillus lacustris TaxID=1549641 RepID=A0A4Q9VNU1_9HYPH|nr:phasin [Siculibacillus lacustris]TBW37342.1 phasin [Siculibacillus lacustris]
MTQAKTPTKRTAKAPSARAIPSQPAATETPAAVSAPIAAAPVEPAPVEAPVAPAPVVEAPAVAAAPVVPPKPAAAPAPKPAAAPVETAAFALPTFELPKFDLPAFDLPKVDLGALNQAQVPAAFRDFAEKAVAQAKANFEKLRDAAEEATDTIEDVCETARAGLSELNSRSIDAIKANSDAAYAHAKDLLAVKTVAEAIELQASFLRQQFEAVAAQAKGLQATATKLAGEAAQPTKDAFDKAIQALKPER